jgi:hypothetical protein
MLLKYDHVVREKWTCPPLVHRLCGLVYIIRLSTSSFKTLFYILYYTIRIIEFEYEYKDEYAQHLLTLLKTKVYCQKLLACSS